MPPRRRTRGAVDSSRGPLQGARRGVANAQAEHARLVQELLQRDITPADYDLLLQLDQNPAHQVILLGSSGWGA